MLTNENWFTRTLAMLRILAGDPMTSAWRDMVSRADAAMPHGRGLEDVLPDVAWTLGRVANFARPVDMRGGKRHRGTPEDVLLVKCARAALADITGDWSCVARHERPFFKGIAARLPSHAPRAAFTLPLPEPAPAPDIGPAFEFAYPWTPRSNASGIVLSRGVSALGEASGVEAPVACRVTAGSGAAARSFAVRFFEGRFLRPVFAPGGWEPIGVDAFRESVSAGTAWQDNPFDPATNRAMGNLGLADYGRPQPTRLLAHDALTKATTEAHLLAVVGPLLVVDGIVHRTCGAPEAVLLNRERGRVLTWALDDLHGETSMDTVRGRYAFAPNSPGDDLDPFASVHLRVPLQEAGALAAFKDAYMATMLSARQDDAPAAIPVIDLDPDLLPPRPAALLRAVSGYLGPAGRDHLGLDLIALQSEASDLADRVEASDRVEPEALDAFEGSVHRATKPWTAEHGVTLRIAGLLAAKAVRSRMPAFDDDGVEAFKP